MSTVAQGRACEVVARTSPSGSMTQPTPPQSAGEIRWGKKRFDDSE
jgi:hypothetical protein